MEDLFRDRTKVAYVWSCVKNVGFEYCFDNYSDFKEVTNKNFQEKLAIYKNAKNDLENYILTQGKKEIEQICKERKTNQK